MESRLTFAQTEVDYYKTRIEEYGIEDGRVLGYSSYAKQVANFKSVLGMLNGVSFTSILDLGCGKGDFYPWVVGINKLSYYGIDIIPEFVEYAKNKWPMGLWDVRTVYDINKKFDIVVSIGTFTKKIFKDLEVSKQFIFDSLRHAWLLAQVGFIFTLELDTMWKVPESDVVFTIGEILKFVRTLSNKYVLSVKELEYNAVVGVF